jgi:hypothetical protein
MTETDTTKNTDTAAGGAATEQPPATGEQNAAAEKPSGASGAGVGEGAQADTAAVGADSAAGGQQPSPAPTPPAAAAPKPRRSRAAAARAETAPAWFLALVDLVRALPPMTSQCEDARKQFLDGVAPLLPPSGEAGQGEPS